MFDQSSSKTTLDPNFVEVISLLNNSNVPYWACHGTLLGLIRDGGLIPWDHDIDIAIWEEAFPKISLIKLMTSAGYILKNDGADYDFVAFYKDGGREVDFNYYRISPNSEMAYSEWYISRSKVCNFLEIISNRSTYTGKWQAAVKFLFFLGPFASFMVNLLKKKGVLYKSAGYTTPVNLLKDFETLDAVGVQIRVPCASEAVLEYIYGKHWRVPKQQYDWTKESPATRISNFRFK